MSIISNNIILNIISRKFQTISRDFFPTLSTLRLIQCVLGAAYNQVRFIVRNLRYMLGWVKFFNPSSSQIYDLKGYFLLEFHVSAYFSLNWGCNQALKNLVKRGINLVFYSSARFPAKFWWDMKFPVIEFKWLIWSISKGDQLTPNLCLLYICKNNVKIINR